MRSESDAIRVLLVEDDEDDYIIFRNLLREAGASGFILDWEPDFDRARQTILQKQHDVYVLDYRLGAQTGIELLEQARAAGIDRPFLILTGLGESAVDQHAIELGAADYLVKGKFDGQLLSRSIRYARDRHLSQRLLIDSEARYRLLFDANPEAIWVFARESLRLLAANASASRFLGYARDELLAMRASDIRCEDGADVELADCDAHGEPARAAKALGVRCFRHKDGRDVYGDVMAHGIDYAGESACMVVAIDVSDKIAAERAKARQQEVFRNVLRDARDAMVVVSAQGRICYANEAAESLFERSADELRTSLPALPEVDSDDRVSEWTLERASGKRVDVDIHRSETEWDGEPALLLSMRDATGRKDSQRQMRLLQRSLDYSFNGIVITDALDPQLPIIYVNRAFERITGYTRDEVLGRNSRFLQNGNRDELAIEEIRQGLARNRDVHVVVRNFRKDGSEFWNDLYISPVFDEKGVATHFIGVQNDVSERKRFEEELRFNASHDFLTGLPNRALFEDRLRQACQTTARHRRRLAVVFVDLDRFKPINDSYGHETGDQLLIQVARRLEQSVRAGDTVSRLGGDEYILLFPDLARDDDVIPVVERVMRALALPYPIRGLDLHVTPSVGIAFSDGNIYQPSQLIQQADLAMYRAKEEGRNNYQLYTSDLNHHLVERLTLRNELQLGLNSGQFELYYQPQFSAASGRATGLEALVRWRHPTRGLTSPGKFISVAEDSGLMIPLGQWILETACRDICSLAEQGLEGLTVAVNISPRQFQRSNFVVLVRDMVEKFGLGPGMLEIELTESVLIDQIDNAIASLREIRDRGVRVSLDDFGTGYSSLNYLRRLPIDKLKIDRSFIRDVTVSQHDAAITQAILLMAHHLQLRVVAEGVETGEQVDFLIENRCHEFQGFYFAKPMPFSELVDFLRNQPSGTAAAHARPH